jgi:hypothetical protein
MPTEKTSLAQFQEEFDLFVFEMSEMLKALERLAASAGVGTLDFGYESLDQLESLVVLVLDGKLALPDGANTNQFMTTVARYVGETVVRRIGGRWSFAKSSRSRQFGQPSVAGIPGLPKTYDFLPLVVARGYGRSRRAGWLREQVEKHDLAALRARVASFDRCLEGELKSLAREVETGQVLDFSVESLTVVERLLAEALDAGIEPDDVRRLADRIALYMGEVYRRRAGGGWNLVENPVDVDFGEMRVRNFAPRSVVVNFLLRRRNGLLEQAMRSVLARSCSVGDPPMPPNENHRIAG